MLGQETRVVHAFAQRVEPFRIGGLCEIGEPEEGYC
jgi:hypothetical protein